MSTTHPERTNARPKNRAGCGRSPSLPAAPIGSCGGRWEGVTLQGCDSASPLPLAVAVGGGGSRAAGVTGVAARHQVKTSANRFSRDRGGAHEPDRRCGATWSGRQTKHWAEEENRRRGRFLCDDHPQRTRDAGEHRRESAHFPFVISNSNHEDLRQRARLPRTTSGGTGPTSDWLVAPKRRHGLVGAPRM